VLKPYLRKLAGGTDLTRREAAAAMDRIMDGAADDAQIAAFAMALHIKGETAAEIAGCALALRRRCVAIRPPKPLASALLDTCGTGGDGLGTLNVSTLAAFIAAGAGQPVAKHGNRAVSSRCGSADLLEQLGIPVDLTPEEVAGCLKTTGLAFLFAPRFHPAMRHAAAARRSLGLRTIFNLLGPLCNPAGAPRQLVGVFPGGPLATLARVMASLGTRRALLVHGTDGMDELTVTGPSDVVELRDGRIRSFRVTPEEAGLRRWKPAALAGGGPEENAGIALAVLGGGHGAARDISLLNSGAALMVGGRARTLAAGVKLAAAAVDSGSALRKLEEVRAWCQARRGGAQGSMAVARRGRQSK